MKVAAVQMNPHLADVKANRRRIKEFAKKAGEKGADLIVFPELCNSGYNLEEEEVRKTAEKIPGPTTQSLETVAKENESTIVVGINERGRGDFYNSAAVLGPEGHQATYRKIHLFNKEKRLFEPGRNFVTVKTENAKIGVMICFDWFFPESTRILALRGAEVIIHPANLVLPYCQRAMPIRSLVNKVFSVTANRIGEERGLEFTGRSQINNPSGTTLEEASKAREEIITAEIDPSKTRDKNITERNHVFEDIKEHEIFDLLKTYQRWQEEE